MARYSLCAPTYTPVAKAEVLYGFPSILRAGASWVITQDVSDTVAVTPWVSVRRRATGRLPAKPRWVSRRRPMPTLCGFPKSAQSARRRPSADLSPRCALSSRTRKDTAPVVNPRIAGQGRSFWPPGHIQAFSELRPGNLSAGSTQPRAAARWRSAAGSDSFWAGACFPLFPGWLAGQRWPCGR